MIGEIQSAALMGQVEHWCQWFTWCSHPYIYQVERHIFHPSLLGEYWRLREPIHKPATTMHQPSGCLKEYEGVGKACARKDKPYLDKFYMYNIHVRYNKVVSTDNIPPTETKQKIPWIYLRSMSFGGNEPCWRECFGICICFWVLAILPKGTET